MLNLNNPPNTRSSRKEKNSVVRRSFAAFIRKRHRWLAGLFAPDDTISKTAGGSIVIMLASISAGVLVWPLILGANRQTHSLVWISSGLSLPSSFSPSLLIWAACFLFGAGAISLAVTMGRQQTHGEFHGQMYQHDGDETFFVGLTAQIKEELGRRQEVIAYGLKNTERSPNRFVYENFVADYLTSYITANPQLSTQGIDAYLALTVVAPDLIEVAVSRREFDAYQTVKSRLPLDETETPFLVFLAYLGDIQPAQAAQTPSLV